MSDETDHRFSLPRRGVLLILSAPSGVGKTTLSQQLLRLVPDLQVSVSYTTRQPRRGEIEGKDYYFVTEERFVQLRQAGMFAEWAQVHEFFYGTPKAPLDRALSHGTDMLLDIDVQGARQLKQVYREAVSVFVLPPSWAELENRLRKRRTESEALIARRLQRAREEVGEFLSYDYWLVNDRVEQAVAQLQSILTAERARISRLLDTQLPSFLFSPDQGSGRVLL